MSNSLYDYAEMANLCDTNGVIRRKIVNRYSLLRRKTVKRYSLLSHEKRSKCKIAAHHNPLTSQKHSGNHACGYSGQLIDSFKSSTICLT